MPYLNINENQNQNAIQVNLPPIRELSNMQARTVRCARRAAINSLTFVIDKLNKGELSNITKTYLGISTLRQQQQLAQLYTQVLDFVQSVKENSFIYDSTVDAMAYVYPGYDNRIYLGKDFFRTGLYGVDSQVGTIVHEVSHLVLGTDDFGYGRATCKILALADNKFTAKMNADSIEAVFEEGY